MKSNDIVPNLLSKLSDDENSVRSTAIQAIKSSISISTIVKQLQDTNWITRQQAVQLLT